jgi:Mn2+/Fe2+ NRAMP family transporter
LRRLGSILLWSVIAAAFIGPGTVTAAASAGASYGVALAWALAFSTLATLVLQEAAGRLALVSGRDLAQALAESAGPGLRGVLVVGLMLGAVLLGNAAYEAGNILGGVAGAQLALDLPGWVLTLAIGGVAALLLWLGSPEGVARLLAIAVALMGLGFCVTAAMLAPPASELLAGLFVPTVPAGAGLLVLGLVGTTVVPYNLFLGSGLARGQSLADMRLGLAVAVVLGGLISIAVMVVGGALDGEMEFAALATLLDERLGGSASVLFALGLFAAGLSSAVTAPLAASITARGLFGRGEDGGMWNASGWRFRAVWLGVLGAGLASGLSGVRPVPAIILAQAFNGVILPLVAIFLFASVNNRRLVGEAGLARIPGNILLGLVVLVALVLGLSGVGRALAGAFGGEPPGETMLFGWAALLAAMLAWPLARFVMHGRQAQWHSSAP